jgi:hypothetical protein
MDLILCPILEALTLENISIETRGGSNIISFEKSAARWYDLLGGGFESAGCRLPVMCTTKR